MLSSRSNKKQGMRAALRREHWLAIVAAALILHLSTVVRAQDDVRAAFTIQQPDLIPEGIAYDSATDRFFVGSTYRRNIVSIDANGAVTDVTPPGNDRMWGVLGMEVDEQRRRLWVVSSHAGDGMPIQEMEPAEEGHSALHLFDVDTMQSIRNHVLADADAEHFLNDLVIAPSGQVFITDSGASVIWTVSEGDEAVQQFVDLQAFGSPNGITLSADGNHLYVALWGDRDLVKISLADKEIAVVARPEGVEVRADGLYFHNNSLVAIEPFSASKIINRYLLDEDGDEIVRHEVLVADHPLFLQPTTGVIVDDTFYFIANSQLQQFRRLYAEFGTEFPQERLQDVVIAAIGL